MLVVVLLNLSETVDYTAHELDLAEAESEGSPSAIIGGIFYLLGFSSSLYHLVFLSAHRVYAIALPIHYHLKRSNRSVYIGLAVVWLMAIVVSTFPRKLIHVFSINVDDVKTFSFSFTSFNIF